LEPVVRNGGVCESLLQQVRVLKRIGEHFLRTFPSFCIHKCTGKTINDDVEGVNWNRMPNADCQMPNDGDFFDIFGVVVACDGAG
jgi:hypothetical protein